MQNIELHHRKTIADNDRFEYFRGVSFSKDAEVSFATPLDYFKTYRSKPRVTVPNTRKNLNELTASLSCNIFSGQSTNLAILDFLYNFISLKIEGTLTKEWKSFGISIGKEGDTLSPIQLLEVRRPKVHMQDPYLDSTQIQTPEALFASIIGVYRRDTVDGTGESLTYTSKISSRIDAVISRYPFYSQISVETLFRLYKEKGLYNEPGYTAMVASLDMFWNKFPRHPMASLKVSTVVSRYKDCTSVGDAQHLSQIMGMKISDAKKFIFIPRVSKEVKSIMRGGNEIHKIDSYMPYCRDFDLILNRSPYSAATNPNFHVWVHLVCAALGSERSRYAKLFNVNVISEILNHALFIGYFISKPIKKQLVNEECKQAIPFERKPRINEHALIYSHLEEAGFSLPEIIRDHYRIIFDDLPYPRAGTVGEYFNSSLGIKSKIYHSNS